MRHRNTVKKLNRPKDQRVSLIRNLLRSLVVSETMNTTEARYKVLRGHFDKLVNMAKADDNTTTRRMFAILRDTELCDKAREIAKRYENKNSGFTKSYKLENRKGDNAKMVRIELSK